MPNIPGLSNAAQLGRGIPGGAGGLPVPGSGLGGISAAPLNVPHLGITPLQATKPTGLGVQAIGADSIAPTPTAAPDTNSPSLSGSSIRLTEARNILHALDLGQITTKRAKDLLKTYSDDEKSQLASEVLDRATNDKTYKPKKAIDVLSVPAAAPPGSKSKTNIIHNLGADVKTMVSGMVPGLALTGKAIGTDVVKGLQGKSSHQFEDTVAKPVLDNYAQTYGPALHGDIGATLHQIGQHPLGPILDATALASGGLGAVSRAGDALDAVRAGRVADIADGAAAGGAKVGDKVVVQQQKNGLWMVRNGSSWHTANLPDKATAIKVGQTVSTGALRGSDGLGVSGNAAQRALGAAVKGGARGGLIDAYENARGITHETELKNIMEEVGGVLDGTKELQVGSRSIGQIAKQMVGDLKATRAAGKARPVEMGSNLPQFIQPGGVMAKSLSTGETALREATDMVRAGAIYLRPAYLPNNWAGNSFMTAVHQGVWAPINLAKSLVVSKHMDPRNLAAMRQSMGTNAAEAVTAPTGRGYVASLTHPVAHVMGALADQPFRDAAFLHEARKMGYSKLSDVNSLFDQARLSEAAGGAGDTVRGDAALRTIADISRKAQEEIVKFGHMNDAERSVIRNLVFVYSWIRGASRYAGRFPMQHAIQSTVFNHLSDQVGQPYLDRTLGGIPSFMLGSMPVGKDKNGNPILINPFALNPLGTGLQAAQALAGTAQVIRNPRDFDKYAQSDIVSMLNPIAQSYLNAREGGKPPVQNVEDQLAPIALAHALEHPGSGSIYPTSRTEALGHYTVGSLFPRVADQQAITRSLERQNQNNPVALIPEQVKAFKKATGTVLPPDFINQYKQDLELSQQLKDFQHSYATKHGSSGFKNLPAANQVDAAIQFLHDTGHVDPSELTQYQEAATQMNTDAELKSFANSLFGSTGVGEIKREWDRMMNSSRGLQLTRKR